MEKQTAVAPTAVAGELVRIFLALELSRSSWLVASHTPAADKISRHKLAAGDIDGLLALIERLRTRVEQKTGQPVQVISCYEAGYDGFWLDRKLKAEGVINHVMDPASIQVDRRARRVKTDAVDADALLRALMAFCRGEKKVCSMVRVPTRDEEDAKRLSREREQLIKERVRHVNRIKGLRATQGIYDYQPLKANRLERLDELCTGDGNPLPDRLKNEIRRQLERLKLLLELIGTVEAERDAVVKADKPASEADRRIRALAKLRGIGPEIATVLYNEVFYRQFANRRDVAAYVGLTPSLFASGDLRHDQGISKAGNPRARATMVELAWLWVRHQSGSALTAWFLARVSGIKGRIKRIAIVALARKLLVALWRYLETGLVPTGAMLKADKQG
ncbi:MAG TPA: IS110 family transposase [Rhodopila sp.]